MIGAGFRAFVGSGFIASVILIGPRSVDFRGCLSIEVASSDTRPPFRTDIDRVYAVFLSLLLHMEFLRHFSES